MPFPRFSSTLFGCVIATSFLSAAGAAQAQNIQISCQDRSSYIVQTRDQLLITNSGPEQITWSFDGEWLRVQRQGGRPDLAFGLSTGMRLMNGQSPEGFCAFDNPQVVASLPMSEGANLRAAFVGLPAEQRRILQQNLSDFGYYPGEIDGLWGRGTEHAIMAFFEANRTGLRTGLDPRSAEDARLILAALAGWTHEGSECDGCDEDIYAEPSAPRNNVTAVQAGSNVPTGRGFACSPSPFDQAAWMQRNSRQFATYAVVQEVEDIGRRSEGGLSAQEGRRLVEIYEQHAYAPAAEEYAISLFGNGDLKASAEWFAKAARDGMPMSSSLMFYVLGQKDEFAGVPAPPTAGPAAEVVEQCLRLAVRNGEETAGLHLATVLISPPDIPPAFARTSGFADEEALRLLGDLPADIRAENRAEIETMVAIAQGRLQEEEKREQARQAERVAASQAEAESLEKVCDGAIQLKGVCMAQTKDQMKTVLTSRNYSCGISQGMFGPIESCTQGDQVVTFYDNELSFSCANFNACKFTAEELAQEIVNQGFVSVLEPDIESFSDGVNTFHTMTYCGRGGAGDELCVKDGKNLLGQSVVSISLLKGALGSGGIRFD